MAVLGASSYSLNQQQIRWRAALPQAVLAPPPRQAPFPNHLAPPPSKAAWTWLPLPFAAYLSASATAVLSCEAEDDRVHRFEVGAAAAGEEEEGAPEAVEELPELQHVVKLEVEHCR